MSIEELIKDESFAAQIDAAGNLEEVAAIFRERGVEVTANDLKKAMDAVANDELSEDRLEDVAGGFGPVGIAIGIGYRVAKWLISRGRK